MRYVLDGSLRREGHRLRVAARLTDDAGAVLWADRFEEELDGIFEVQDRITATVVGLVEPRITQAEFERSRRKPPQSVDAYDHFLRGTARINHPDSSAAVYDAMVHHLDRAVALDPSFPQALACAGWAHEMRRTYGAAADRRTGRLRACPRSLRPGLRRWPGTTRSSRRSSHWSATTSGMRARQAWPWPSGRSS